MFVETFYLNCLAQASYLIASESEAIVIDPQRDIQIYLEAAKKRNVTIKYVFETHHHADFVSGHLEFAKLHNAIILMGSKAKTNFNFIGVADGTILQLGKTKIQFLETPGHTPESVCAVLYDENGNTDSVFTGDTLFIGDVGRPDLFGAKIPKKELAAMLYNSLQNKLLTLPDTTKVYPGHGAGSMCGKALSSDKVSTIGKEKMTNYALKSKNQDDFIKIICENQPTPPKYFAMDVEINKNGAKPLDEILSNLKPFSTQEILVLENQGAIVLDSRNHLEFSKKCIPNSLNVGIEGQFATWSGCVLDKNSKVVVIAPKGKEQETAIRLARVGIDTVLGYLEGGIDAWQGEIVTKNRVKPQDLNNFLKKPNLQLIDIRGTGEFQTERLKGFVNLPLNSLADHVSKLNPEKETLLFCKSSYRSSVARTYLENIGFKKVTDVEGGLLACKEKGIEIITEACPNS